MVLAAPHSRLRKSEDQTDRMLAASRAPGGPDPGPPARPDHRIARGCRRRLGRGVRGRGGAGRGDRNRWRSRTAGPRSHAGGARACDAGCLFALDSDAHTTGQLAYAETAIAHARLAGIPADTNRQLLAAGSTPVVAVRANVSHPSMSPVSLVSDRAGHSGNGMSFGFLSAQCSSNDDSGGDARRCVRPVTPNLTDSGSAECAERDRVA